MEVKKAETKQAEPTPLELANSWLDFRESAVQKEIAANETSRHHTENYKMKHPGARPSWIESGGMDESDYEMELAEYNQWPDEQEDTLNYLDNKFRKLDSELITIDEYRDRLEDNDLPLIEELAEKEKGRREKIEIKQKRAEEFERVRTLKREGTEMNGVSEAESVLQKIIKLGSETAENEKGKSGWELRRAWDDKQIYDKNNCQVEVTLEFSDDIGVAVRINTFLEPITPFAKRIKNQVDNGIALDFTLKEGKIYNWDKGRVKRSYQYGYPESQHFSAGESFEQTDFDNARKVLSELYSGLESLTSR